MALWSNLYSVCLANVQKHNYGRYEVQLMRFRKSALYLYQDILAWVNGL